MPLELVFNYIRNRSELQFILPEAISVAAEAGDVVRVGTGICYHLQSPHCSPSIQICSAGDVRMCVLAQSFLYPLMDLSSLNVFNTSLTLQIDSTTSCVSRFHEFTVPVQSSTCFPLFLLN